MMEDFQAKGQENKIIVPKVVTGRYHGFLCKLLLGFDVALAIILHQLLFKNIASLFFQLLSLARKMEISNLQEF